MIIANNINKQFGKLKVLDNVSVTCNKGECIALIGPNASGKTTFIKCVLGMVVCDSGFITFNGKNILHNWQYRADIGYMPQIGRYPDSMTIGQVLGMMKDIRMTAISNWMKNLFKNSDWINCWINECEPYREEQDKK